MIADSPLEALEEFVTGGRLQAVDVKGDTPLHIAARSGSLLACDLFIRAGADQYARNQQLQTPAEVARAEGHDFTADLLFSLLGPGSIEPSAPAFAPQPFDEPGTADEVENAAQHKPAVVPMLVETWDDAIAELAFEAEVSALDFFSKTACAGVSADQQAVGVSRSVPVVMPEVPEWDIDDSSGEISGDGIGFFGGDEPSEARDDEFLKVRRAGRQSVRTGVVPSGTRISIDSKICRRWVSRLLAQRYGDDTDIDELVRSCGGNGVRDDLQVNLRQVLTSAGFPSDDDELIAGLWELGAEVSAKELSTGVEASLTRATKLPGLARFEMSKSNEARWIDPLLSAKRELQLGILSSGLALDQILADLDLVLHDNLDPASVSMKTVSIANPDESETLIFLQGAEGLANWVVQGKIMDGRPRRQALKALNDLDLTLEYYRAIVKPLLNSEDATADDADLTDLLDNYEQILEQLMVRHLPFVRRFAARNVEDGDDPEDVFQVAFMGLQRSTRRFNPNRGHGFAVYAQYWMRQSLARWRADEGAIIRIPVHLQSRLSKFDQAVERLDAEMNGQFHDEDIVAATGIDMDDIRSFREIPRTPCDLEEYESSDLAKEEPPQINTVSYLKARQVVAAMLEELPEREADIVRKRFGIGYEDEMTLEEVGQLYGVTRERIRQLESKALGALGTPQRRRVLRWLLER